MNKLLLSALLLVVSIPSWANDEVAVAIDDQVLTKFSVASVATRGFSLDSADTVAWRRDIIWLNKEATAEHIADSKLLLKNSVDKQLANRGITVIDDVDKNNYDIVVAVIIGDSVEGEALLDIAHLQPGLEAGDSRLETGIMLIGLARPESTVYLWRASLEGIVAGDLSAEARATRFDNMVASILNEMPAAE